MALSENFLARYPVVGKTIGAGIIFFTLSSSTAIAVGCSKQNQPDNEIPSPYPTVTSYIPSEKTRIPTAPAESPNMQATIAAAVEATIAAQRTTPLSTETPTIIPKIKETPTPTKKPESPLEAGWKRYKSTYYPYQIDYPGDWETKGNSGNEGASDIFEGKFLWEKVPEMGGKDLTEDILMAISSEPLKTGTDLDGFSDLYLERYKNLSRISQQPIDITRSAKDPKLSQDKFFLEYYLKHFQEIVNTKIDGQETRFIFAQGKLSDNIARNYFTVLFIKNYKGWSITFSEILPNAEYLKELKPSDPKPSVTYPLLISTFAKIAQSFKFQPDFVTPPIIKPKETPTRTPENSLKEGWTTFRSVDYPYQINYPPKWKTQSVYQQSGRPAGYDYFGLNEDGGQAEKSMEVSSTPVNSWVTVEDYIKNRFSWNDVAKAIKNNSNAYGDNSFHYFELSKIKISGQNSLYFITSRGSPSTIFGITIDAFSIYNGRAWNIKFYLNFPEQSKGYFPPLDVFPDILKSFKFLQ